VGTRSLSIAVVVAVMLVLHFTVRPILDWRAGVDFLTIALLVVAVRVRPGVAAVVGFALGLLSDALAPEAFGAGALAMTIVGFAASRLKAAFFADNVMINVIFVFVGKVAFDVIFLVAERRLGGGPLTTQLLLWTPTSAFLTAIVGLFVMSVVRPTLERRRG